MSMRVFEIDPVKLGLAISKGADIDFLFKDIPGYMDTRNEEDPIVYKKVTGDVLPWTWYIYEADREEEIFSAYVVGDFPECGSVMLDDLKMAGISIDKNFKPKKLSEIQNEVEKDFWS